MKSKIVEANEKIAEDVQKIQDVVVNEFSKIEDSFISRYLLREGESLDEAKERLKREEQEIRIKENEKENLDYRTSHSRGGQLSLRFL